ncbi:MAG: Prolipoprotein diacylglyceryl transferase [Candidatus Curtissbacteria bacterium GW2011_GWA1_40_24]|uniref:Phosphatidylglycerol--prolipoprotein diacylglyceryl transferase n=1 Tax=Candidatus Curtissbacteria bacterium GW2011_GWA1_40_24 TaxID=1618406 RepID=A0A0G0RPP0_9BACT|nr:MAG: Prolipoprotein diacylglyceryl transferase [Candidatus Curtissbacteria bacterium GW2011_GWA1_40_24]
MIPRSIEIGPLSFHLYGLIIAFAIFCGWYLAKKRAKIYRIPQKIFDDPILLIPLALSIIGARAYHVLDYWSYYSQNLIAVFYLANGGLGIWGGILGMLLGFLIVAKVKNLDFLKSLDLAAPSVILGQAIGRFGNYVNQEGFGPPTNLPWGVFIDPQNRPTQYLLYTRFHPTFFYEVFLNLIFFILLLYLAGKLKVKGQIFALYLVFYSVARFITEFWRIDTWVIDGIKISYLFSVCAFIFGVMLFWLQSRNKT